MDLEKDAAEQPVSHDVMGAVGRHVTAALEVLAEVESLTAALEDANRRLTQLQTVDIPQAMLEANLRKLVTPSGTVVEIKRVVRASIPKPLEQEAFEWLKEHNSDDIIKDIVAVELGRGNGNLAVSIADDIRKTYGLEPTQKRSVHASTLSAWARERLEKGETVPPQLFSLYDANHAVFKK